MSPVSVTQPSHPLLRCLRYGPVPTRTVDRNATMKHGNLADDASVRRGGLQLSRFRP